MRSKQCTNEALAEFRAKQKREEELAAYGSLGFKKWIKKIGKSSRPPPSTLESSPISGLSLVDSSSTIPNAKLQSNPSWGKNVVGQFKLNEKRKIVDGEEQEELESSELKDLDLERDFAYPLPIPPLTQQQLQLQKKIDILEHTTAAALATVNVTTSAGKEALYFVGKAFSFVVPSAIKDAREHMLPMVHAAAETVGLDFTETFDLSHLDASVARDWTVVDRSPALTGISISMRRVVEMLKKFIFNQGAASIFLRLIYSVLSAFAQPVTGIIATSKIDGNRPLIDPYYKQYVAKIEEVLHSAERLLSKFTCYSGSERVQGNSAPSSSATQCSELMTINNVIGSSHFVCDPLIMTAVTGSRLLEHFQSLHEKLVDSIDAFCTEVGLCMEIFDIREVHPSYLVLDSLHSALAICSEAQIMATARRTGSTEHLKQCGGLASIRAKISDTTEFLRDTIVTRPQDLLGSPAVTKWWVRCFNAAQRVSPDEFIKHVFLETGGKSNLATDRVESLMSDLERALRRMSVERDGLIGLAEFAIFFRAAPSEETNIFKIVELATLYAVAHKIKLLPCLSPQQLRHDGSSKIVWEDHQEAELGRALHDTLGWTLITGPRGSGKSARVLSTLQWMPKDRDVMYVDLSTCRSTNDVLFAIAAQLLLRDCATPSDVHTQFRKFFKKNVRAHGILVLDNFETENLSLEETQSIASTFESAVLSLCAPYTKVSHFVLVSTSFPKSIAKGFNQFVIPPLSETQANLLAKLLLPVDPGSLAIAGKRLAGEMFRLAKTATLATTRKIAAIYTVDDSAVNAAKKCLIDGVEAELSDDQLLCACCMLTGLPHFPIGLAWALCSDAFLGDILRWRVAWQGLLDVEWVKYSPSLGFWVPTHSLITRPVTSPVALTLASQTNAYTFFWANELVKLNGNCYESTAAMLHYDLYRPHFRSLLMNVLSNLIEKDAPLLLLPESGAEKKTLVKTLSGKLDRVLNARYSPSEGEELTRVLLSHFSDESSVDFMHAQRAHGLQMLRIKDMLPQAANAIVSPATRISIEPVSGLTSWDNALFDISMGLFNAAMNRVGESIAAFKLAQARLEEDAGTVNPSEFTQGTIRYVQRVLSKLDEKQKGLEGMTVQPLKSKGCTIA